MTAMAIAGGAFNNLAVALNAYQCSLFSTFGGSHSIGLLYDALCTNESKESLRVLSEFWLVGSYPKRPSIGFPVC